MVIDLHHRVVAYEQVEASSGFCEHCGVNGLLANGMCVTCWDKHTDAWDGERKGLASAQIRSAKIKRTIPIKPDSPLVLPSKRLLSTKKQKILNRQLKWGLVAELRANNPSMPLNDIANAAGTTHQAVMYILRQLGLPTSGILTRHVEYHCKRCGGKIEGSHAIRRSFCCRKCYLGIC